MGKRESKVVVKGVSVEQYNEALKNYAAKDAKLENITSKMDVQINNIRDKYKDELDALTKDKEEARQVVETYCVENPDMFGKKRSVDTIFGSVGFRTGTPKLKLASKMNWAKVLDNLKSYLPGYVRTTEQPAKDRLLTDRELPEVKENLQKVGLVVDQDERFFIELKKEEVAEG